MTVEIQEVRRSEARGNEEEERETSREEVKKLDKKGRENVGEMR